MYSDMCFQCLLRNRIPHPKYENLISKLLNGERLPQEASVLELLYVLFSVCKSTVSLYLPGLASLELLSSLLQQRPRK